MKLKSTKSDSQCLRLSLVYSYIMAALSFLNLKFIHLFFLLFWSVYSFRIKDVPKVKISQWVVYFSSFLVTVFSGFLLLFKVGIMVDSLYPMWVKLKVGMTIALFLVTTFQIKTKKFSDYFMVWIFFIFMGFLTYFSVFRVYL